MKFYPETAIICVDDDQIILNTLSFQIEKLIDTDQVICEYFDKPDEALATIPSIIEQNIHVIFVLTDYQMPKITGAEFICKIKERFPDISCIMLSGQANDSVVEQLLTAGVLDYFVAKPWSEEALFEKIKLILPADKLNKNYIKELDNR